MFVLLVEDNPGDAELIRTYLAAGGEQVDRIDHVNHLQPARETFDEPPNVVLLDLNLPDASPGETIDAIEELSSCAGVVVMTGQRQKNLELRALKAGADEFLEKDAIDETLLPRSVAHAAERFEMREELRQRERELERYRTIVEHSTDAVRMKDAEGNYRLVNQSFLDIFETTDAEVLGRSTSDVFDGDVAEIVEVREQEVFESGEVRTDEESEVIGDERTLRTTRIPFGGDDEGVIAISRDVTEQKEMREELEERAMYDRMTGLPNRTLFRDRLRQTIERAKRDGTTFALGFLDLDNLKEVNDSLGHLAGDMLIKRVAERLRSSMRAEDTVARVGGDEFTIILQTLERREELESVGRRIRDLLSEPVDLDGTEVHVTASIGFSLPDLETLMAKPFEESFESMTRAADRAMYRAKDRAGTSWQLADLDDRDRSDRHVQWDNQIRKGLRRGEFLPYFQPVFRGENREVMAYEMFARWQHPERGMISPGEFIPVAEESTLIDDITRELLEVACEQFARAEPGEGRAEGADLFVNVSPGQFARPELFEELGEMIAERLPTDMDVGFEITETALLHHTANVRGLRKSGFRFLVDDFGTGHSSISRLKEMPVDTLKLDRVFVHGIGESQEDEAIVETVVQLGNRLGLCVIAEGVETRAQYDFLRSAGCPAMQGFWLGRPGPLVERDGE